jgi:hypothetical protein
VLDLGDSGQVVFLGWLANEFTAGDFLVIACSASGQASATACARSDKLPEA